MEDRKKRDRGDRREPPGRQSQRSSLWETQTMVGVLGATQPEPRLRAS